MITRTLKKFLDDYAGSSGVWVTFNNNRLERVAELPRELREYVKTVATSSGGTQSVIVPNRDAITRLLHHFINQSGTPVTLEDLIATAENWSLKFDEYAEGPSFRILKVLSMEGQRAAAEAVPGQPVAKVAIGSLGHGQVRFALDETWTGVVASMSEAERTIVSSSIAEFCQAIGLSKAHCVSSKAANSGRNVAIEVFPTKDMAESRNKGMMAIASGFVDREDSAAAPKTMDKLPSIDITLGEKQKVFYSDNYYVPGFLRGSGSRNLFPDKTVCYDAETIVLPDGTPIGLYSGVNKAGQCNTAYTLFYNDFIQATNAESRRAAALEVAYGFMYLVNALRGKDIFATYIARLTEALAAIKSDDAKAITEWLVATAPKVNYPANRVSKGAVDIVMGNMGEQMKSIQLEIDRKQADINALFATITQRYQEMEALYGRKLGMEMARKNKEKHFDKLQEQVNAVCANKYIRSLHIYNGILYVYTNNVEVVIGNDDLVFDIGRLLIVAPMNKTGPDQIRFFNLDRRPNGKTIPHAHDGANVCWGNKAKDVDAALRHGDIVTLINLLLFFATTVNIKDPYGIHIVDFPVSKRGRIKKLTATMKNMICEQRYETESLGKHLVVTPDALEVDTDEQEE
jgi:hypothetical protein